MKWSIHVPNAQGIAAAATWPASLGIGSSPRKSSIAPTTHATAAPSRMPRISPSSERNASDGTRIPRKIARPPSRGIGRLWICRPPGAVTTPRRRAIATDRGRQEHDHDERDQRAPEDFGVRAQLFEHATRAYFVP